MPVSVDPYLADTEAETELTTLTDETVVPLLVMGKDPTIGATPPEQND